MNFDLPKGLRLEPHHQLQRLVVATPAATGTVYLHGAHITAWQPTGHQPVIWLSRCSNWDPAKPIRGGVPLCFPWFGPLPDHPQAPMHGFARTAAWSLDSASVDPAGVASVCLALNSSPDSRKLWPFDFRARFCVSFGPTLAMSLSVTNVSPRPCSFEQALHSYFTVGNIKQVKIHGLASTRYIDKTDHFKLKDQDDKPIRIEAETDRVYLDTTAPVTIEDPDLKRKITLDKSGSHTTVIWNPWIAKAKSMSDFGDEEWPGMICVESANAAKNRVVLPGGATHTLTTRVCLSAL
jgi:glucose-6-phosphate 1-epimerase